MKISMLPLASILLLITPQIGAAEMIINTTNGRQYTVPVNSNDIRSIEFRATNKSGGIWQGTWKTSEGNMNLFQSGKDVKGTYNQDNGRIEGEVSSNVLNGYWAENTSSIPCEEKKLGSLHWGKISFQLNSDNRSFSGKWSYCNDEPSSDWTGER